MVNVYLLVQQRYHVAFMNIFPRVFIRICYSVVKNRGLASGKRRVYLTSLLWLT